MRVSFGKKPLINLIILGNGFDLAHNLPTKYSDFKSFCKDYDENLYDLIMNSIPSLKKHNWNNFEDSLSQISPEEQIRKYIEPKIQQLVDKKAPDCEPDLNSDSCEREIIQYVDTLGYDTKDVAEKTVEMIATNLEKLWTSLPSAISEWVRGVDDEDLNNCGVNFFFPTNSFFFTFNYSHTLEKVYKIPSNRIWHIHGAAGENKCIIGAGINSRNMYKPNKAMPEYSEGYPLKNLASPYLKDEYLGQQFDMDYANEKIEIPYDKIKTEIIKEISNNIKNIQSRCNFNKIRNVYIIGHSLSDVDKAYFEEIASNLSNNPVRWFVFYHQSDNQKETKETKIRYLNFMIDILSKYHSQEWKLFELNDHIDLNVIEHSWNRTEVNSFILPSSIYNKIFNLLPSPTTSIPSSLTTILSTSLLNAFSSNSAICLLWHLSSHREYRRCCCS